MKRLPLLDEIKSSEWREKIARAAFAPKGKKREREKELREFVRNDLEISARRRKRKVAA